MEKDSLIKLYESKIKYFDKKIRQQKKYKKQLNKRLFNNVSIYNFVYKLYNRFFQTMLVLCSTILAYISFEDLYTTILISLLVLLVSNIIRTILLIIYKPDGLKYNELQECVNSINDLIVRRNIYFSIYNYLVEDEKFILYNLKLKINNKNYFDFYKYINEDFIKNDEHANKLLKEMKVKENILTDSIKNRIYLELKYPTKTEELTNEQLIAIQSSL